MSIPNLKTFKTKSLNLMKVNKKIFFLFLFFQFFSISLIPSKIAMITAQEMDAEAENVKSQRK